MLPFEHVKKAANPTVAAASSSTMSPSGNNNNNASISGSATSPSPSLAIGANRSGALRPHSRSSAAHQNAGSSSSIPFTSPNQQRKAAKTPTSTSLYNNNSSNSQSKNNASLFNTTINTSSAAASLTSPLKPSSARRSKMLSSQQQHRNNNRSPSPSSSQSQQRRHRDMMFGSGETNNNNIISFQQRQQEGVAPSDVIPDFQLCVNYKKVDITVNDAKQHLRVRPPHIRAAVASVDCDLEPFEFPHLLSVACGLDDVGVDHSVLFFVVAANPECFAVAPTVDCEGTLRFQASAPPPGSVHLEKTSLHITAWDALSLTGSDIETHADEVQELEDGVPFCEPIKLDVTLTHASIHNNKLSGTGNNNASNRQRSPSPTRNNNTNNTSSSLIGLNGSSNVVGSLNNTLVNNDDDDQEEQYEPTAFPRLNPNLLRDPFVVLGNTLQSRVVQSVTAPVTDTELLSLGHVRQLFLNGIESDNSENNNKTNNTEQELRKTVDTVSKELRQDEDNNKKQEELCEALTKLGLFVIENGSSLGETTAVEVFEKLVQIRHQQQPQQKDKSAAKNLLTAYNLLAASEVAIGSFSDASSTLDLAFRLCQQEEAREKQQISAYTSPIKDEDAVWTAARRVYVLLVRGEAEEALKLLRHPSLAEADTVFVSDMPLRTLVQVFGACARCALGRFGETIRKLRQVVKQFQKISESKTENDNDNSDNTSETNNNHINVMIPEITILQCLILTCIRTGDITQARSLITTIVEEYDENFADQQNSLIRGITCVLANMASVYSPLPPDLLASFTKSDSNNNNNNNSSTTIIRSPSIVIRAVDAWQALMLDPHSTKHREFIRSYLQQDQSQSSSSSAVVIDVMSAKLRVLDAAVSVATSSAAVSGNVEKQRKAVEHAIINKLSVELQPYHPDVVAASELLAWIELCSGDASSAAKIAEPALRDLRSHGVDTFDQAPRLAQLLGQANGILNNLSSQSVLASTNETLDDATMRYGEGTRALFTPLVDRAIAEINSNQFAPALEKLHKALKIVDSGNAIFLLGPLFRPAAQLSQEELNERARLSKGRVDTRAASDFALILFAMASVAEAENRLFDAETLLLQVLAALELAGIEESISTAAVYRSMSQLLFEDGHFGDSLAYAERAEKLLHTKYPYATSLKKRVEQTQQYIEFKIRASGYSLKRISDTRFRFAVFV